MNIRTKQLVLTALLTAISLVFGLTVLGYIPIGPIQITIMCVPVIIGTILLGFKSGLFLGVVFAFTSVMQIFIYPNPLYGVLFVDFLSWCKILIVCIVPRLLVPVTVFYVNKAINTRANRKNGTFGWILSSAAGSLTNTVFFLGLFWLLFSATASGLSSDMYAIYMSMFTIASTVNAGSEIIFCCIVCPAVIFALNKAFFAKKPAKENDK